MPDENRVFDVTKPKHVSPGPTSRPVIVGHQLMVKDPMVKDKKDDEESESLLSHTPMKIDVTDDHAEEPKAEAPKEPELKTGREEPEPSANAYDHGSSIVTPDDSDNDKNPQEEPVSGPAKFDTPEITNDNDLAVSGETVPDEITDQPVSPESTEPVAASTGEETTIPAVPITSDTGPMPNIEPHDNTALPEDVAHHPTHIEGLHFAEPRRQKRNLKWIIAGVVVLIVAVYLLLDSGLISTGINLPFHVFKQEKNSAQPPASSAATQAPAVQPASNLPAGFKLYNLSGTPITFAAPSTWGEPTSETEQGYAKRGGTNQPSGTYSYLVTFATNKDIQIAVTSNQYLPPARDRQYYDYLQWCTGTNDGKFYQSILNYTTDSTKVDTPSTVSCDQGPLSGATKLDDTTLLVSKAADASNKTIGDIYIKNMSDKNLPVFRVKDAAMTNGADIKNLLDTVKLAPSS